MSIEALAMAGVDCNECQINLEDMEDEATPQHLLADHHQQQQQRQFDYLRYKHCRNTIIKKRESSHVKCDHNVDYLQQSWQIKAHDSLPSRRRS